MKKIIIFLTGFVVLLTIASCAVKPSAGEVYDIINTDKKLADVAAEKDNSIDVMFAGNSLLFRGMSPLQIWGQTGITSYDLSEGAMRLCDQCALIMSTYDRQTPELIVLEPDMFFDNASPYKDDYALPTNLIEKIFPIFHYHTFYKAVRLSGSDGEGSLYKGFEGSYDVDPYTKDPDYMKEGSEPAVIPELNRKYLDEIVDFCNKKNITLLIMAMPSPKNYSMGAHNAVQEWADSKGLDFLDLNLLNDEIGIDWATDTKDRGEHLNFDGSRKVTAYVAGYLKEHYDLKDHRGDKYYSNWDEDLKEAGVYQ
ncbi:MAG: hypothetical protein J5966_00290 [Lachnospiraceae bacterium]|nr:hypothetical protein [Lachnospiraceae bacterium]